MHYGQSDHKHNINVANRCPTIQQNNIMSALWSGATVKLCGLEGRLQNNGCEQIEHKICSETTSFEAHQNYGHKHDTLYTISDTQKGLTKTVQARVKQTSYGAAQTSKRTVYGKTQRREPQRSHSAEQRFVKAAQRVTRTLWFWSTVQQTL